MTGASGGVGRAVVRELGAQGAKVALIARGTAGLGAAAVDVGVEGGTGQVYEADVADYEQVRAAAERIEKEMGPISVWINTAFSSVFAKFTDISPDEYERTTAVTYLGYVWGTKVALDVMRPRNAGAIVQTGSALSQRGIPLQSAYCGAKHAIKGFTESVRTELLSDGSNVRVTLVQLPAVNTPSSTGCCPSCAATPSPSRRSISPRWPRGRSCTPPRIQSARSTGSAAAPSPPCSPSASRPLWSTATSPGRARSRR
ncbi:SDR family oxidoreductase [Nonomuraea thailandensis]